MAIVYSTIGHHLTAILAGEVDHHGGKEMMEELRREIDSRMPKQLTLSLEGVTFMDSSGIALLLRTKRQMEGVGGALTVINIPHQAKRVLEAAQIERWVDIQYS